MLVKTQGKMRCFNICCIPSQRICAAFIRGFTTIPSWKNHNFVSAQNGRYFFHPFWCPIPHNNASCQNASFARAKRTFFTCLIINTYHLSENLGPHPYIYIYICTLYMAHMVPTGPVAWFKWSCLFIYFFVHTVGPQPCASSPHSLNQGKIWREAMDSRFFVGKTSGNRGPIVVSKCL